MDFGSASNRENQVYHRKFSDLQINFTVQDGVAALANWL